MRDRCERIAQIKDVHIYRLVNQNTIEEGNPRDLFGDLTQTQFEETLIAVEEDIDRQAAVKFMREMNAESNEFDEEKIDDQVEKELRALENQVRSSASSSAL